MTHATGLVSCDVAIESGLYDCETCGACCVCPHDDDSTHPLSGLIARIDQEGRHVCSEFCGYVGVRCSCETYENRPEACRRLQPGSSPCQSARARFAKELVVGSCQLA